MEQIVYLMHSTNINYSSRNNQNWYKLDIDLQLI